MRFIQWCLVVVLSAAVTLVASGQQARYERGKDSFVLSLPRFTSAAEQDTIMRFVGLDNELATRIACTKDSVVAALVSKNSTATSVLASLRALPEVRDCRLKLVGSVRPQVFILEGQENAQGYTDISSKVFLTNVSPVIATGCDSANYKVCFATHAATDTVFQNRIRKVALGNTDKALEYLKSWDTSHVSLVRTNDRLVDEDLGLRGVRRMVRVRGDVTTVHVVYDDGGSIDLKMTCGNPGRQAQHVVYSVKIEEPTPTLRQQVMYPPPEKKEPCNCPPPKVIKVKQPIACFSSFWSFSFTKLNKVGGLQCLLFAGLTWGGIELSKGHPAQAESSKSGGPPQGPPGVPRGP